MHRRNTDQVAGAARQLPLVRRGTEPASIVHRGPSPPVRPSPVTLAGPTLPGPLSGIPQGMTRASTWSSGPLRVSSPHIELANASALNGSRAAMRRLLGAGPPDEEAHVIGITCRTSQDGFSRHIKIYTKVEVGSPHAVISLDRFVPSEQVSRIRQHIIEHGLVSANNRLAPELTVYIDDTTRHGSEPAFRYRMREKSPGPGIRKRTTA